MRTNALSPLTEVCDGSESWAHEQTTATQEDKVVPDALLLKYVNTVC